MRLKGVVRSAELQENSPGSDQIELLLRVQGVGPGQPRSFVIPFSLLLRYESLEADEVAGRGFDAEVEQDGAGPGSSPRSRSPPGCCGPAIARVEPGFGRGHNGQEVSARPVRRAGRVRPSRAFRRDERPR